MTAQPTGSESPPKARRFVDGTLLSWDAAAAVAAILGATFLFLLSPAARKSAEVVFPATAGVSAGILGIVLAAMAVVTAFMTRAFVAAIRDLAEALAPFKTIAVISAVSLLLSLSGLAVGEIAPWWLDTALLVSVAGFTTWAIVGTVQLVELVIFFAQVRAGELLALNHADKLRNARLTLRDAESAQDSPPPDQ